VTGQESVDDNETADLLARTGSEHPFTVPEAASGISITEITQKNKIK
jgi:hypothetical protein